MNRLRYKHQSLILLIREVVHTNIMNLSKSKDRKGTLQTTESEEEEALYSKELQLQTIRVSYQNQCEVHEIPEEEQHN